MKRRRDPLPALAVAGLDHAPRPYNAAPRTVEEPRRAARRRQTPRPTYGSTSTHRHAHQPHTYTLELRRLVAEESAKSSFDEIE